MVQKQSGISTIIISVIIAIVLLGVAISSLQTNTEPTFLNADLLSTSAQNNTIYTTSFPDLVDGTFQLYVYENFTLVGSGNYTPINITTGKFNLTFDDVIEINGSSIRGRYSYYPVTYVKNSSSRAMLLVMLLMIIIIVLFFVKIEFNK